MSNIQKIDNELAGFVGFIQKGGKIKPFSEDIYLITLYVAGLDYVDNIDELFPKLKKGQRLELFRESDNKYDSLAILVYFNGEKIGYVPRKENTVLANLMDAGKELYGIIQVATIDEVYKGYKFKTVEFKVFMKD